MESASILETQPPDDPPGSRLTGNQRNRPHGRRNNRSHNATANLGAGPGAPDSSSTAAGSQRRHRPAVDHGEGDPYPTHHRRPYKPRRPQVQTVQQSTVGQAEGASTGPTPAGHQQHHQQPSHKQSSSARRNPHRSRDGKQSDPSRPNTPAGSVDKLGRGGGGGMNSRRAKFGGKLTDSTSNKGADTSLHRPSEKYRSAQSLADDLTSRLIRDLSAPPYPDCPICFASIYREQPIWSCSPSIPIIMPHGAEGSPQYCWTTFHLKCIRSWASKSVKDVEDAWRARGEQDKVGDWRCPGCQGKRETVPKVYWCFCGSMPDPKPPRLATPHSCASPCSRIRETGCGHPCPLSCHPGPCPPCQVTTRVTCYCPRKTIIAFRCGIDQERSGGKGKSKNLSCGNVCGRLLGCGKHTCEKVCHEGECGRCDVKEMATCYCGKKEKEMMCGEGEEKECFVEGYGTKPWVGRFACEEVCNRLFDCGIHHCQKPCHPPSPLPAQCPFSPSLITNCPCGRSAIAPYATSDLSNYVFPARTNCASPIPICSSICSKPHPRCGHPCKSQCHIGPCPPCTEQVTRPCRCGLTIKTLLCHELFKILERTNEDGEEKELLCDRPCTALRACGKHECRRICCPLASLSIAQGHGRKGKKRVIAAEETGGSGIGQERGGLHECDLVCGKMLSCGNHCCEERDHKGACPPCLRSSFEEMVCHCGRTVYEPPIPCGTQMHCTYPCTRPPPPCGHPRTPHACHEDTLPCPPCVHLTTKLCACGKKTVPNVRCSLEREKVSCGTVCGKLLGCGGHKCERMCHADACGACTANCGKWRKLCLPEYHPCTLPCHAPSSCPETDPCQALVNVSCPCGRIKQAVRCGRSSNQAQHERPAPKCTNDCAIAKRNARLAEALGITPTKNANISPTGTAGGYASLVNTATYSEEVVGFARVNPRFLALVEKAFSDFASSGRKVQVLPHMPPDRRKFVHDLAAYYRIDTQLVDQEPHRSVQLIRRVDTRIPMPLLSTTIQQSSSNSSSNPNLGKLNDLRTMRPKPPASTSSSPSSSTVHLPMSSVPLVGATSSWRAIASGPSTGTTVIPATSSRRGLDGWEDDVESRRRVSSQGGNGKVNNSSGAPVGATGNDNHVMKNANAVEKTGDNVPDNWEDDI